MEFDNFSVRLLSFEDAAKYFQLIENNRKRLEDFFAGTVSKTKTLADTQTFISDNLRKTEAKTYFPFIVVDDRENIIGFIDVKNIDWTIPKAELGCFIDKTSDNKGISQKALRLVIAKMFDNMGFNKLFLRTHQTNTAARRLAEKCGFELEGVIRSDYKTTRGELVDLFYYGLLKNKP